MAYLGIFGGILFLIVGLIQISVGYIGIEYHFGTGWAIGALVLGFGFRIMLPLTIGTFFGALDVWDWPWYGALALAAPGLLFVLPSLITAAIYSLSSSSSFKNENSNSNTGYFKSNIEEAEIVSETKHPTKTSSSSSKKLPKKIK
jgi:hypothetical protein